MEPKRSYVRVLQWRRPSYILTIPPSLVLRMGIRTGQGIVLDEHKGMLIGIPASDGPAKKNIRAADKFAESVGAIDENEVPDDGPYEDARGGSALDKLRL